jgi:hypothetical protein
MAAGLPGVGLSGIFFIISALVAVPLEVIRTARGESSFSRWSNVLRHFALAILMIGAMELFYSVLRLAFVPVAQALPPLSHGILVDRPSDFTTEVRTIPLLSVLSTIALVALVMGVAKVAELVARGSQNKRAESTRSAGR